MFARADRSATDRGRMRLPGGTSSALWIGVVLATSANDVCAAAFGNLVTSVGLFAALATLLAMQGWPADLPGSALTTAGAALAVAGGAVWLWKTRAIGSNSRFAGAPPDATGTPPASASADHRTPRAAGVCLPAGPTREAMLAEWRLIFVRLQAAWDEGAVGSLRALTTPEMLEELCHGLPDCDHEDAVARTDVVTLRADLFAFDELADAFVASVEFSGLMRESPGLCAVPFKELWLLTKSKDRNSDWKLARHLALL